MKKFLIFLIVFTICLCVFLYGAIFHKENGETYYNKTLSGCVCTNVFENSRHFSYNRKFEALGKPFAFEISFLVLYEPDYNDNMRIGMAEYRVYMLEGVDDFFTPTGLNVFRSEKITTYYITDYSNVPENPVIGETYNNINLSFEFDLLESFTGIANVYNAYKRLPQYVYDYFDEDTGSGDRKDLFEWLEFFDEIVIYVETPFILLDAWVNSLRLML